jgi:hypothetical protein
MGLRRNNFEPVQGFTPNRIVNTATLPLEGILAIRISTATPYTINNTGSTATMPAGVTVVANGLTSYNFTSPIAIEVMDEV